MENAISAAITWLGMSPQGIVAGSLGAALSLFFVNGNRLSVKNSAAIMISGAVLSGYGFELLSERFSEWTTPAKSATSLFVGFMAADFMASVKKASPTFTNWLIRKISGVAKNRIGNGN